MTEDYKVDLSNFDGVVKWIEDEVLSEIKGNYNFGVPILGMIFLTMTPDGDVLPDVMAMQFTFDDEVELDDLETVSTMVKDLQETMASVASSGVLIIIPADIDDQDNKRRDSKSVVVSLEHKGGKKIWIARGDEDGLNDFESFDVKWIENSLFGHLLPVSRMN